MSDFEDFMNDLQNQFLVKTRELYSETVIEHFLHPRHFHLMDNPDGYARIKGPCGDTMEVFIRVRNDEIAEASFLTDGCMTTIASASMAVELAAGRSIPNARRITQNKILDGLGGLPKESQHCALLASNTLRTAISLLKR